MRNKPWKLLLLGWAIFLLGHPLLVAIATRLSLRYARPGMRSPFPRSLFERADFVVMAAFATLVLIGTCLLFRESQRKYLLIPGVVLAQAIAAFVLWFFLS